MANPIIIPGPWSFLGNAGDAMRNLYGVRQEKRSARIEDEDRIKRDNQMALALWEAAQRSGQVAPGTPAPPGVMRAFQSYGLPVPEGPSAEGMSSWARGRSLQDLFNRRGKGATPEENQQLETALALALNMPTGGAVAQDTALARTAVPKAEADLSSARSGAVRAGVDANIATKLGEEIAALTPDRLQAYFKIPSVMDMATVNDEARVRMLIPLIDEAKGDMDLATKLASTKIGPEIMAGMTKRHISEARYAWEQVRLARALEYRKVAAMEQGRFIDVLVPAANQIRQQINTLVAERSKILGVKELGKPLTPEAIANEQELSLQIDALTGQLGQLNDMMMGRIGPAGIIGTGSVMRQGVSDGSSTMVPVPGRGAGAGAAPPPGPRPSPLGRRGDAINQAVGMLMDGRTTPEQIEAEVTAGTLSRKDADDVLKAYRKRKGLPEPTTPPDGLMKGLDTLLRSGKR